MTTEDKSNQRIQALLTAMALPLALLSSCDSHSTAERQVIERVKARLTDPDSAQFRNVHEIERKGGWIVCGEVNSKNRLGGYVGFKKFSATEVEGDLMIADPDTAEGLAATFLIEGLCKFPPTK